MADFPKVMTEAEASAYLKNLIGQGAMTTLRRYRVQGGGPAYRRIGRSIRYLKEDLDEWALQRLGPSLRSTSEYKPARAN